MGEFETEEDLGQCVEFPSTQDSTCNNKIYGVGRRLTSKLTTFHRERTKIFKARFYSTGSAFGAGTVELGLILHVQTRESYRNITPFCNLDEPTIRSFARKRLSDDFTLASTDTEEQRPTFANVRPTIARSSAKAS